MEIETKHWLTIPKKYNENKVQLKKRQQKHDPSEWPKGKFVFDD